MTTATMAQDVLLVKSGSETTELQLSNEPTMTIGETITVTDGTTTKSFNTNQRIALIVKDTEQEEELETYGVNKDGKVDIEDVTSLVNHILKKQ